MTQSWFIYALASAFFAALTAIFAKMGISDISSNLATFIRTTIIALLIAALLSVRREWVSLAAVPTHSLIMLTLSALATGLSWLCYYHAIQLGPVSRVAPMDKLSVAFVVIFSVLFLGEQLTLKTAIGSMLIFAGALVMAL